MADDEPCTYLEWDSRFFGVETVRVVGETLTPQRSAEIDRWCVARGIKFLYLLARPDDAETVRCAEQGGYALTDIRMLFEKPLASDAPVNQTSSVRPFEEDDLPSLRQIARSSFTDSRFYYDPRVPRAKADELFDVWVTKAAQKDPSQVLVARRDGRAVGFVTCDLDASTNWGSIGLIGVDESVRGQGVGRALVEGALAWAILKGLPGVTVVTQGRNIAAQRLYQRCGFVTRSVRLYYHKWYE